MEVKKILEDVNYLYEKGQSVITNQDILLACQVQVLMEIRDELQRLNQIINRDIECDQEPDLPDQDETPEKSDPAKEPKAENSIKLEIPVDANKSCLRPKREQDGSFENYM